MHLNNLGGVDTPSWVLPSFARGASGIGCRPPQPCKGQVGMDEGWTDLNNFYGELIQAVG